MDKIPYQETYSRKLSSELDNVDPLADRKIYIGAHTFTAREIVDMKAENERLREEVERHRRNEIHAKASLANALSSEAHGATHKLPWHIQEALDFLDGSLGDIDEADEAVFELTTKLKDQAAQIAKYEAVVEALQTMKDEAEQEASELGGITNYQNDDLLPVWKALEALKTEEEG